jgi:hypothetical protein
MPFIKTLCHGLFACALFASAAGATTIIQSSGNSEASVPLGTYQPYLQFGMTPIVYAVEWTDTSDYTDVNVSANLFTPGSPGTVNYELVTAIGPGTSFAADGVVKGTVATPANPTDVSLFQLNFLKAGTYYLVLDSPVANTSWQYNFPFQSNYTTAPGVTFAGDQYSYGTSINTGYAPGSLFQGINYPVEFAVTGTVATPEPATFAGAGLALVWLSIAMRRSVTRKRRPA